MSENPSPAIRLERRGSLALITIDRPAARNALDPESMQSLLLAARSLDSGAGLKGVLLLGQTDHFCAGGDIRYFQHLCSLPESERLTLLRDYVGTAQDVIRTLAALPCPLVACVDGAAAGFGLSLVCLADRVIASSRSRFLPAYTAIAASPDGGLSYLLTQLLGERRALQWVLHNHAMPLTQALEWGLISELQPAEAFEPRVQAIAAELERSPATAFRNSKRLIRQASLTALDEQLDNELQAFLGSATDPDFAEGLEAFFAKRPPTFAG